MENRINFVEFVESDIALTILSKLDDPADVVRAAAVSLSWRHFVINNHLAKNLCLRKAPMTSNITNIIEIQEGVLTTDDRSRYPFSFDILKKDHMMYMHLLNALSRSTITPTNCIGCVIGASSTDHYPWESVINVLSWTDQSYWSSKGHNNPNIPEAILFKLDGGVCIVTEIDIQPFECFFHPGNPIYSANSVRFRMGRRGDLKVDVESLPSQQFNDDNYIWEYTSPEYPMSQESSLQYFKLPEPVLCIGGYLKIELLGRSQIAEMDGLYYFCISHVQVLGHSLKPAFDIEMGTSPHTISLKYCPEAVADVRRQILGPNEEEFDREEEEEEEEEVEEEELETESDEELGEYSSDDEFGNPQQNEPL